ncbi:hypothetical protein CASFOL_022557 [Castilleja foliolosa]|uniref:Uncharacterized protein n=1 Tax=Castilleja foliolosa TaxID=1961234 RepID=A0ABD3CUV6_9LAMI
MVFLHSLTRGSALFARRLEIHSSHFLISLCTFDALVAALQLSEGGEEAQLKRIAELQ